MVKKRNFEGNYEILRTIFQPRVLSSDIPASRKGVYLLCNPPNNFSTPTHVDPSCIFGGFFRVSRYGIVIQLFTYQSLASVKSLFWFSLTNEKFIQNVNSLRPHGLLTLIIHQIFSLARDWSKRVTWANIPQLKLGNIRGYSPIFKTDG